MRGVRAGCGTNRARWVRLGGHPIGRPIAHPGEIRRTLAHPERRLSRTLDFSGCAHGARRVETQGPRLAQPCARLEYAECAYVGRVSESRLLSWPTAYPTLNCMAKVVSHLSYSHQKVPLPL